MTVLETWKFSWKQPAYFWRFIKPWYQFFSFPLEFLWWLILCASVTRPRGAQIKHYSGCVCAAFPDNSVDGLPSMDGHHLIWIEQKVEEEKIHSLPICLSWLISLLLPVHWGLHHQLPWFSDLQTHTGFTPPAFLGPHL